MDDKDCKNCEYYKEPDQFKLGKCVYPIPVWVYASRHVNRYEAKDCLTYKHKWE